MHSFQHVLTFFSFCMFLPSCFFSFLQNVPLSVPFGTTPNEQLPMNLHPLGKKKKILESPFYLAFQVFIYPHEISWPLLPARAEPCNNWPRYRPPGVDGMIRMIRYRYESEDVTVVFQNLSRKCSQTSNNRLVVFHQPRLEKYANVKMGETSSPKNRGDFKKIVELPPSRYICNIM